MEKNFKIFVIVAIVALGLGIAASTFYILSVVNKEPTQTSSEEKNNLELTTFDVADAITTNVYEENGYQHVAKIQISFGVDGTNKKSIQAFKEKYEASTAQIRDEIIQIMREQTYAMMSKADAQAKLGDEITLRINKALDTDLICKVYFKEFFVQ